MVLKIAIEDDAAQPPLLRLDIRSGGGCVFYKVKTLSQIPTLEHKEDYLLAMERSPIKDIEIKHLLKNALTDKINDRLVFMKGIDHSYYYEGYSIYKTEDLK